MKILMLLFKSNLPYEEIERISEERKDEYRQVSGLINKMYVEEKDTGKYGGIFKFDSQDSLLAFRESDLAKSTEDAYKFIEPPEIRVFNIAKQLRG